MIGRELDDLEAISAASNREVDRSGVPVLKATGVGRRGALEPADLEVFDGEVVGLAGLLGSGRTELARLLYGADRADTGPISVDGEPVKHRAPRATPSSTGSRSPRRTARRGHRRRPHGRREHRAGHPGPPRLEAPAPQAPSRTPSSPSTSRRSTSGRPNPDAARQQPLRRQPAEGAPGPLAGDRARAAHPRRAHARHRRRRQGRDPAQGRRALGRDGLSVIFISSELEEVLRLAQRIVVMRDRRKIGELDSSRGRTRTTSSSYDRQRGRTRSAGLMGRREAPALLAHRRAARCWSSINTVARPQLHQGHRPRRPALRRADRHPAQQRAAHARRARHDPRDRHPRHRPVGRRRDGDRRAPSR